MRNETKKKTHNLNSGSINKRKAEFVKRLKESNFYPTQVCIDMNMSYHTYLNYYEQDPKFRSAVDFVEIWVAEGVRQDLLRKTHLDTAAGVQSSLAYLKAQMPDKFDRQKNDTQLVIQAMFLNFLAYVSKIDKELGNQLATYQIEFLESQEKDETKKITK